METKTIRLKKPVQVGEELISDLVFRTEATVGDMMDMPADASNHTIGDYLAMAAKLCGKPLAVLKKLSTADMEAVLIAVGEAVAPGQSTGAKG